MMMMLVMMKMVIKMWMVCLTAVFTLILIHNSEDDTCLVM